MQEPWNDEQPIYRQLRDKVASLIMSGEIGEGEFVPSVRQVSADYQINHLTVGKAYQQLVDENVLQMKRGRGMFVLEGARQALLETEKLKFIEKEVPVLKKRMQLLGLSPEDLRYLLLQEVER